MTRVSRCVTTVLATGWCNGEKFKLIEEGQTGSKINGIPASWSSSPGGMRAIH